MNTSHITNYARNLNKLTLLNLSMLVCPKGHEEHNLWLVTRIDYWYCKLCHKHYSKDEGELP